MCKVISVVNQKGGVGKTTTTVNVGIGLAREGKKVLLIDADPQGSLTASLGYEEPDDLRITLATIMMDVINEEEISLEDGILHHQENVDLLPANIELSALEVTMGNVMSREMIMKEYIDAIRCRYDYILIDCMPSLGMMTINALVSSDSVLIPVQAAYLPVKGLQQLIKTILTVKKRLNRKLAIEGILLTMVDFRTNYANFRKGGDHLRIKDNTQTRTDNHIQKIRKEGFKRMNVKKKARRVMSGLLTAVTVLSTVLSPTVAYASDDAGSVKKIPYYEEIKDQLDEDEVVTAKDYEIKVGDNFDVKSDYTGLTIQDDSKVKVTFQEAKDTDGNDFSTDYANSYKAVYYVEPQTTDHPTYQINRKIVVKEADQQKDSQSESSSDQEAGSFDETETEDSEAGSSTEETGDAKTESKTELTEKEFDAEIEATEDQETVDPETGITLSEVMQEAVDQEVALADLEAGESITFDMPMMLASGETGTKSVTVTAGSWYYYADYGLGSYLTCPYYVKWGSINATAYCVEPSKKGPGNGTYTIQKLADGKTLAKVCYYGTKASDENGFFDEKHPDFPAGKRFIITHLAAAYANGSSDWASGTNATGKNLAMELYNYCVNMPDIPSVDMSFSESNVKAYVEGNSQRTSVITFKADKLQTITFKLPKGVKLVNVTTGKTSAAGANVEISGGTKFYLIAPLNQAENVSATFSSKMKGSIDKEYSAYKITTGSGTQDLALVFGEGVGNEKYVDFKVTWTKECKADC